MILFSATKGVQRSIALIALCLLNPALSIAHGHIESYSHQSAEDLICKCPAKLDKTLTIIESNPVINLATTSAHNEPMSTALLSAVDPEFNFYWASPDDAAHSENILVNPHGYLTIDNTLKAKVKIEKVTSVDEMHRASGLLSHRDIDQEFGHYLPENVENKPENLNYYKATVESFFLTGQYDDGNDVHYYTDYPIEPKHLIGYLDTK